MPGLPVLESGGKVSAKTADLRLRYPHGPDLCRQIAAESPTVLLAFSRGKDALASFCAMRESRAFKEIILFHEYLIPNLQFVNDSLKHFEDLFGQRIYNVPHPSLYRWLNNLVFQPPENCAVIERYNLPSFSFADLMQELKIDLNLPPTTYTATGVRAADSLIRRMSVVRNGPVNQNQRSFLPIWDWSQADVRSCLERNKITLPVDYEIFGRTFDGIDYRFLKPIHDRFPEDFARILKWFPLADLELYRREFYEGHAVA